jgi:cell division protein FtsI (penicillin-binding protein 3)
MNDPKYLVIIIVDEPQEKQKYVRPTGGIVAAPVVKNVISRTGPILGLKPQYETEEKPKTGIHVDNNGKFVKPDNR